MAYKKSEETKKNILETAKRLFCEKGYYNTDLKDIAGELGMAHTAVYYYFKNKEDIASKIYDEEIMLIIDDISDVKKNKDPSPLFLCLMQYTLIIDKIALNPATEAVFFDMIDYRKYDNVNMARVRKTYYFALEDLFSSQRFAMSDDEMTVYILTSDAYAKALLSAMKSGVISYNRQEALDHFFRHLILADMNITFEEYAKCRDQVFEYIEEREASNGRCS